MGHNVTVLRFKKKILNKSINISSRFYSGHFYFRLCWRKKNQQLIVFPGIFSIKFQCFMCKQITFQCCSIGNLVQSTKIKIIQKILAMVHFHQPRFTIRDVVPSFLSWGFIWIWKRDFKGKTKSRWPSSSAVQSLRSAEKHGTHVLWWKMPKSEVNTDHNENLFIKILLGSRQCASSFTTISWWLDFSFLLISTVIKL